VIERQWASTGQQVLIEGFEDRLPDYDPPLRSTTVEWHGTHACARCACGKLVRVNKPLLGALHLCLTGCELRGTHRAGGRRVGPFWRRRTEICCLDCGEVIPDD